MSAAKRTESYVDLARWILERPSDRARLVAVDGAGGSGKSVFAGRLAGVLGEAPVVHTDDFATGQPHHDWWPRLEQQVIRPLSENRAARYQRYDWGERRLAEWHEITPAPVVIIDGVSSARRAVKDVLALAIWVQAPRETRLARGLARDGGAARSSWDRWMAEEDEHFRSDATIERCEVIVDGAPDVPHDPDVEFVRLSRCSYD